jgi:fructokinase
MEGSVITYGAIEAGGTRWVCALVDEQGEVLARRTVPTTTPEETLVAAIAFFGAEGPPVSVGVGSFGPLDLRPESSTYGFITTTPKPGWANTDLLTPLRDALQLPVAIDTDVNAAAIGERRWGRGAGLLDFVYLTVGTGIGGGAFVDGRLLRGIQHPEMGHMWIPHDQRADPFKGSCPFHGDCLEGLASGVALRERWGRPGEELTNSYCWELEANYLALALVNLTQVLAPARIIIGGGVVKHPQLLELTRARLAELLAGYLDHPGIADGFKEYVTAPGLGDLAGVLGASELARAAVEAVPPADEAIACP